LPRGKSTWTPSLQADYQTILQLTTTITRSELLANALCYPDIHHLFFSEKTQEKAKRICYACNVRLACLEQATASRQAWEEFGVWGGRSVEERRAIMNRRRTSQKPLAVTVAS